MIDLAHFGNIPIDYTTLVSILGNYRSPKDKIAKMEKQGQLIRLKKGLFVVAPQISKREISRELIANHLYGPSYVSFESALSHHGLIPERVFHVHSATTKRAKQYTTPLGTFEYQTVYENYFPIGIQQQFTENKSVFLIASPEKALCDMIVLTPYLRLQSVKAVQTYLEESLRIDWSEKKDWDMGIIRECLTTGKKKTELTQLLKLLEHDEQ